VKERDLIAAKELARMSSIAKNNAKEVADNFRYGSMKTREARALLQKTQRYFCYEFIKRRRNKLAHSFIPRGVQQDPSALAEEAAIAKPKVMCIPCMVLGCVQKRNDKYAYILYIQEIGLEHKYMSEIELRIGDVINFVVERVDPRAELLKLSIAPKELCL
jgi:hypothetical protein